LHSHASRLCETYDYPTELGELLDEIVALALETFDELVGIVLSPSISTGEFLWKCVSERVHFLSDVDGFVFAKTTGLQSARFKQGLARLEHGRGGPLFKLDFSVIRGAALDAMSETYQMVETRMRGFELAGSELLERFPDRFDPRASRQAFLLNLWKPLATSDSDTWVQNAVRLLLDIPLLASSEAGICRPGHRARAEWFLEDRPGTLGADPAIHRAVDAALAARLAPPGSRDRIEPLLLPAMEATIAALDGGPPPPTKPDASLINRFTSWLPPRPARRIAGEFRTLFRRPGRSLSDLLWWKRRKEAVGGGALWGLFQILHGAENPNQQTADWLGAFARLNPVDPGDKDFVSLARDQYRSGLAELYPKFGE
jgi:hypothetical protein